MPPHTSTPHQLFLHKQKDTEQTGLRLPESLLTNRELCPPAPCRKQPQPNRAKKQTPPRSQ